MDVNGTRFHLLLGRRDWQPVIDASQGDDEDVGRWLEAAGIPPADRGPAAAALVPLEWDDALGAIALLRQLPRLRPPGGARPLGPADRRGACVDSFGNLFWIDVDPTRIRVLPAGLDRAADWWRGDAPVAPPPSPGPFRPAAPHPTQSAVALRGLAVTTAHLLVAGTVDPGGLVVQDLDAGGDPSTWRWPEAIGFAPFALAPTPDGGVAILDVPGAGAPRLWRLDAALRPIDLGAPLVLAGPRPEVFHPKARPAGTRPAERFAGPIDLDFASPLDAAEPVDVTVLPDGSILVLDAGAGGPVRVLRYVGGAHRQSIALDAAAVRPHLGDALVGGHAFAFVPAASPAGAVRGQLLVALRGAAQVFAFDLLAEDDLFRLDLLPRLLPLQAFAGKALVTVGSDVWYDAGYRWVAVAEQPRARYFREAWADGAPLRFDGKVPQCVWHRVVLDACVPPGTQVAVLARAADDPADLDAAGWEEEPLPCRRADGSELPFDRPFGDCGGDLRFGTFETLLQSAVGRWLELRLVLSGDGRASPRIRGLRAWYPRFSYLREYLPAVYREEAVSASFLDRFLANPEGMFTAMEGRVAAAEALLDPRVAPPEFLPWLAGWLGAAVDASWDEAHQRLFVRNAWLLFRWRGTPLGLLALVRLATDPCPDDAIFDPLRDGQGSAADGYGGSRLRLVEGFELRGIPGLLLEAENVAGGPGTIPLDARWTPAQGGGVLAARWGTFLRARYAAPADAGDGPALERLAAAWALATAPLSFAALPFSPVLPDGAGEAADWRDFVAAWFVAPWAPARVSDAPAWREFLARRYGHADALSNAWALTGAARFDSFSAVPLPTHDALPSDGAPLDDWAAFASFTLPIRRNAHRFTVLVPALPQEPPETRALRAAQVDAVVRRERPAHTDYEVKPFWALFRVGLARLGVDSVLGDSGRFVAMVLEAGYLGEGWVAEGHPWTSARPVVGRDRLQG